MEAKGELLSVVLVISDYCGQNLRAGVMSVSVSLSSGWRTLANRCVSEYILIGLKMAFN